MANFRRLAFVRHYFGHIVFVVAQIVFFIFFMRLFIVDIGIIDGQSMEPKLMDSQPFLINRFFYFIHSPRRYDLVQIHDPGKSEDALVKRIIGVPGDTVYISNGKVFIKAADSDLHALDEYYLPEGMRTEVKFGADDITVLHENMFFVLGDNRFYSYDSREFGPVHEKFILGHVFSYKETL
jgi:signal peptidase I